MRNQILRLRNRAIMFVGNYPSLFFTMVSARKRAGLGRGMATVTPDTVLVIEGFLRCANTFAVWAFLSAQPQKVRIANHTHVPATIIRAAQWNIPTLVLIREPRDVILSYMLKKPFITAHEGLKEYINYYTRIAPYRDHYVVATFQEVTSDFGAVMERVNQRFDTNFALFHHDEQGVGEVFSIIERKDRAQVGDDLAKSSVPLPEREEIKKQLWDQINDERLRPLIADAEEIYRRFVGEPVRSEQLERVS